MEIFYQGEEVKKDRVIEKLRIELVDKVTPECAQSLSVYVSCPK